MSICPAVVGTCAPEPTAPFEGQHEAAGPGPADPQHVSAAAEEATRENVWSDESTGAMRCTIRWCASCTRNSIRRLASILTIRSCEK